MGVSFRTWHVRRRLTCRPTLGGKPPRYAAEPTDTFLRIAVEQGGVIAADAPESAEPQVPVREAVAIAIKAALPVKFKKEVAGKIARQDKDQTFRDAWADLERVGEIVHVSGHWMSASSAPALGETTTTTSDVA
jgi:hypothetical protein